VIIKNCYRYFMTLVDDYNRAIWTYLMKHKLYALSVLQIFHGYVQN